MKGAARLTGGIREVNATVRSASKRLPRTGVLAVLVAAAYGVGCLAGFALRFPSSGISFFWPPTAILTAALLAAPPQTWPALLLGSFAAHAVVHWLDGIPIAAWPIQFFGNASQAMLAAWLVRRYSTTDRIFDATRSVLAFILGAGILSPAAASVIPAYVYVSLGWAPDLLQAWRVRTISNALAMLAIVPSLLVAWQFLSAPRRISTGRILEFATLLLGVVAAHVAVGYAEPTHPLGVAMVLCAPIPFVLWAAVRFGVAGVSFALLAAALVTISTALYGRGPLGGPTPADTIVGVQLILAANAMPLMFLAGVLEQSRAEHAALIDVEQQNREARQRYALATRAGGVGVWEFDLASGAVRVEGTLKQNLGYAEHEIGDTLDDWEPHVFPSDREDVLTRFRDMVHGVTNGFESEFRMLHKDGSVRWLESKGAVTDTQGETRRVRGTYIDITERKEAAQALRDANDALVRIGRVAAMAEVSASIAHELRQPLWAISSNASAGLHLIEQDTPVAELRELFTDLVHDSKRAARIIHRTHNMFTQQPMRTRIMNLNDVVRDIVDIARPRLVQADVRLKVSLDEQLPAVLADTTQMQQVLFNLVTNAVDAMREVLERPRLLQIGTCHGRRHAMVSVRDSGSGFSAVEAARLFQPFYTTRPGGTGLGLAISQTIVRNHLGALWAVHNVDVGTTFRFKIPIHK